MRGIVTNTMKVQRHEAKKYYMEEVHKMYKEGMLKIEKKWSIIALIEPYF